MNNYHQQLPHAQTKNKSAKTVGRVNIQESKVFYIWFIVLEQASFQFLEAVPVKSCPKSFPQIIWAVKRLWKLGSLEKLN